MKKLKFTALALAILLLLPPLCAKADNTQTRTIYIANNGFEGDMKSWLSWYGGNTDERNSAIDGFAQNGDYCAAILPNSTCWQDIAKSQLNAGDKLYLSAYIRLENRNYSSMPFITVLSVNSGGGFVELLRAQLPDGVVKEEWIYVEGIVSANEGVVPADFSSLQVVLENHTDNVVYFDVISLKAGITGVAADAGYGTEITWQPGDYIPKVEEEQTSDTAEPDNKIEEKIVDVPKTVEIKRVTASNTVSFSDMGGHWAKEQVEYLASCGVIMGVGDGKFEPDREITRLELEFLLRRISTKEEEAPYEQNEIVTREEAAYAFMTLLQSASNDFDFSALSYALNFYDYDVMEIYCTQHISAAVQHGIMKGIPGNYFNPKGDLTRAEIAVIIKRITDIFTQ